MTSFEGDTGPYLQYAHVRLSSIARKNPHIIPLPPPSQIHLSSLSQSGHAREIAFLLATYPDVIKKAIQTHEPSNIVTYAFKLSHVISSAWETLPVKSEQDLDKARARMWLFDNARKVLGASLRLLSLEPLERM
jgi:arginyl-tRNA synthetase